MTAGRQRAPAGLDRVASKAAWTYRVLAARGCPPMTAAAAEGYVFAPPPIPTVPVAGLGLLYPVRRIFCVGRNYAEHAKEMGGVVDREAPWFFMKPADAIVLIRRDNSLSIGTKNFHYETGLVVALGGPAFRIARRRNRGHLGYAAAST